MSDFERLRQLLLAEERESLARADLRLAALERTGDALPDALPGLVRAAPPQAMADALATPVASALGNAVRHNSSSIVDALFPVIGPLIRKAIAEALRGLTSDLNRVLEQSLTPRGIKWRIEAWRSGVPYAQVVLRHTLRYRIDHVFLIERDSGLVLRRTSSPGVADLDADAIAGMLTAIGQFVRDSVGRDQGGLEEARVGEYLLWLLDGPRASLACFIQGVPPDALRELLEERLEAIHARLGSNDSIGAGTVADISLDPAELAARGAATSASAAAPSRWPLLILLLGALVALGWYLAREERWQSRVDALRTTLEAHPGFVLTGIESQAWHSLRVHGLIDADAEALAPVLAAAGFDGVQPQWQLGSHVSGDDPVVLRRARRLLDPPASVLLTMHDGQLGVSGRAGQVWIDASRERAAWVPGVRGVAFDVAPDEAPVAPVAAVDRGLDALAHAIAQMHVVFVRDVEPDAGTDARIDELVAALGRAESLARASGVRLRLEAEGFNDPTGSREINAALRRARAAWLVEALAAHGVVAGLAPATDAHGGPASDSIPLRGARVRLVREATTE